MEDAFLLQRNTAGCGMLLASSINRLNFNVLQRPPACHDWLCSFGVGQQHVPGLAGCRVYDIITLVLYQLMRSANRFH